MGPSVFLLLPHLSLPAAPLADGDGSLLQLLQLTLLLLFLCGVGQIGADVGIFLGRG